jgi:Skp family chaperone for outer membrane proteins
MAAALFLGGCGALSRYLPFGRQPVKFAVVDWDRLVKEHPNYKKWQAKQQTLESAKKMRDKQLQNGRQQLAILSKMKSLNTAGKNQFARAKFAAQIAEKQAQEQDALNKKQESLMAAAEEKVKADREALEEEYRVPLFNLRLKLGTLKMTKESQQALLQEQSELLEKRRQAIEAIEAKKRAYIAEQMADDVAASRARIAAYGQSLAEAQAEKDTGLSLKDGKGFQPGEKELDQLIQSMDNQIQKQAEEEQKLRDEIDSDILSAIKKVNLTRKYTLIFRNPRANISADDITDEVSLEVKKIVY